MELSKEYTDELRITIPKSLGQNIRKEREKKGLSQTELANLINSDRQYLYKIESGKVKISVVKLIIISKTLDVSAADLLKGLK